MGTDGSVPVERVGRAAPRRSFRRRSRKASRRFLRFTVSPASETRIGGCSVGAGCRPPARNADPHPYMDRPPVSLMSISGALSHKSHNAPAAADSCRTSVSARVWANPLTRSLNSWADGDGSHGWKRALARIVQRSHLDCPPNRTHAPSSLQNIRPSSDQRVVVPWGPNGFQLHFLAHQQSSRR